MRKFTDELAAALDHGVDVKGRRIFLHGGVDEDTIGVAIRALYLLSDSEPKPIELFVTSYGGDLEEAFALHDVTRTIKVPVHTTALGKCMSAAPLLVACGEKGNRYASENTQFMLHDVTIDPPAANPTFIESEVKASRALMTRYAQLLGQYTSKPASHWRRLMSGRSDRYFSAEEALDWGLIDTVWAEK